MNRRPGSLLESRGRRGHRRLLALAALVAVGIMGCPSAPIRQDDSLRSELPDGVRVQADRFGSVTGCDVETLTYQPFRARTDARVILAHGFLRDQRRMSGLAKGLAAEGIPTTTLSFCSSRPWRGGHRDNAADMRRLADQLANPLDAGRVVYAGFSAGALSAVIAASEDPRAAGVLALDLVDDPDGTAAGLAPSLRVPVLGLMAEPAPCNAEGNGLAVFAAAPGAQVETITGATHCDFESPTDWLCEAVCARPDPKAETRRTQIIERAVAGVSELLAHPAAHQRARRFSAGSRVP